jgi:hypothetical protein
MGGFAKPVSQGSFEKSMFVENPIAGDNFHFFRTTRQIVITEIALVLQGTTNATVFISFGADRTALGTEVISGGVVVSNTTNGQIISSIDEPIIPAGNFVAVRVTAVTDTPDELGVTLKAA